ncbi:hypothetical protein ACB092_06G110400 [Castanea dentata]
MGALLKVVNFLTPNPPFSKGAHTLSHPIKCVLESPHKKSLYNLSILLARCIGIVKRDKKSVGRLDNVLLSNVSLPPFDKYIFFHPANLHSILSKIGFQIVGDLWDAPNGIPR